MILGFGIIGLIILILLISAIAGGISLDADSEAFSLIESKTAFQPGKNSVSFKSYGDTIAADLYIPPDYKAGNTYPAVIVNPPATGVKEQTAGIYAEKMSKKGYIAMAIDPRGFGESSGIKGLLNPYRIQDDIHNSISFLENLSAVNKDAIFNIGLCAGSGYAAYNFRNDNRITAIGIVSPYLTGSEEQGNIVRKFILTTISNLMKAKYVLTGRDTTAPLVPTTESEAQNARPILQGMMTYYLPGKPGDVPTWSNNLSYMSLSPVIQFNIFDHTDDFNNKPIVMAYGSEAVSKQGAQRFYNAVNGKKEKIMLKGADHFDMYYKSEYVKPVADKFDEFFRKYMVK